MKILVDQCINSHADTMRGAKLNNVAGFVRRENPDSFSPSKRVDYDCLPTIADLFAEGKVNLFTYAELWYEGANRKNFPKSLLGRLFDIPPENFLNSPLERSAFFISDLKTHSSQRKMIEFCGWLNGLNSSELESVSERFSGIQKNLIDKKTSLNRYREICLGLSNRQCLDAYHLWTAECAGMDYFLTMDKKFINALRKSKKILLPCPPITPNELLEKLDIEERKPYPYAPNYFYSLWGYPMSAF